MEQAAEAAEAAEATETGTTGTGVRSSAGIREELNRKYTASIQKQSTYVYTYHHHRRGLKGPPKPNTAFTKTFAFGPTMRS